MLNRLLVLAIKAVRDMVKAPDFDRKMLLLATQLANESDMKPLLLSVLEALLETLANQETHEIHTEAITLIRCIVRLVVKLMGEPGANRYGDSVLGVGSWHLIDVCLHKLYPCPHPDRTSQHRCVTFQTRATYERRRHLNCYSKDPDRIISCHKTLYDHCQRCLMALADSLQLCRSRMRRVGEF